MRLYLSSFRVGDHGDRLVRLVGDRRRTAVVFNAADGGPADERASRLRDEFERLRELDLEPEELDLRDHFGGGGDPEAVAARLADVGLVWVRGGNAFVLRRAAQASGFDRTIIDLLGRDALVYGGYSAGVVLLAPSLRGVERCDDPDELPNRYGGTSLTWEGLGVLPYAVAPHYRSDHPESESIDDVVAWFIDHHVPFLALRDGQVIVVEGELHDVLA